MAKPFPAELYSELTCVCTPTASLVKDGDTLKCEACGQSHPIVDGVPVVLHSQQSVFDAGEVIARYRAAKSSSKRNWYRTLKRFVPNVAVNLIADEIAERLRILLSGVSRPRILVVGGGDAGAGLQGLLDDPRYTLVESDVYFGPRVNLIADGHNLPFRSNGFDAVICQAVLEHVAHPHACIDEIHRVLKPRGVFFADIPFMQPVHAGAYDFTRFSLGGLRLACRGFEEEFAGVSLGPFSASARMMQVSALTLSSSRVWKVFVWFGLPWLIFWLPQMDRLVRHRPQASDAASGVYFIGRKSDRVRSDRDVIRQYWRYHVPTKRTSQAMVPTTASSVMPKQTLQG